MHVETHADTIVVGAGSAGAVIAARATERSDREVLLLEAGPDYPPERSLPRDLVDGTRNSMRAHDWGYRHRPTRVQSVPFAFPRGRVVGGSSAVNTCIALRGQPYDYDEWGARGLRDWSWAQCLPAFKRLERDLDFDNEWHGRDGPIPIRRHTRDELSPWQRAFLDACRELGFSSCDDTNDPTTTGFGPHAMNKVNGERMSAARGYLTNEVRARSNLRLFSRTIVHRVQIERGRVVGVEVEREGKRETIGCARVVLSAGAIATPAILLRSGIGPKSTLQRLGLEVRVDLPAVGARLLDHPGTAIFLVARDGVSRPSEHALVQNVLRYRSSASAVPNDMQLQPGSFVPLPLGIAVPMVTIAACVGKPKGHGKLEFVSTDPRAAPRIDNEFLEHPEDRAKAIEAMELAWLCATSKPMRSLGWHFFPSERTLSRRATIDEWIGRSCDSGYHPCGTVPMGADDDRDAACDGRGRVRGVEGLIVADASLMPTIPSSNTNLPTLMIGERFGEWLREGAL